MKKGLVLLMLLILLCGCQNKNKIKKDLEIATNNYYENYVHGGVNGLDTLEITLGDLRSINDSNIDLTGLGKCSDETKIKATIKNEMIVGYEINIKFK